MSSRLEENRAEAMARYSDIMQLPHPVSNRHPQMSCTDRAAQFSPFAALVGFEDSIAETARLTDSFAELDEGVKELLDRRLAELQQPENAGRIIKVTYFVPDERKEGGAYRIAEKAYKRYDYSENVLVFRDGSSISVTDIYAIEYPEKEEQ